MAAKTTVVLNPAFAAIITGPSPSWAPTHSPTMAPIALIAAAFFRPVKTCGSAAGMRTMVKICRPRRVHRMHQVDRVAIHRVQSGDRVDDHGKERDQGRHDDLRRHAEPEPDDQDRGRSRSPGIAWVAITSGSRARRIVSEKKITVPRVNPTRRAEEEAEGGSPAGSPRRSAGTSSLPALPRRRGSRAAAAGYSPGCPVTMMKSSPERHQRRDDDEDGEHDDDSRARDPSGWSASQPSAADPDHRFHLDLHAGDRELVAVRFPTNRGRRDGHSD